MSVTPAPNTPDGKGNVYDPDAELTIPAGRSEIRMDTCLGYGRVMECMDKEDGGLWFKIRGPTFLEDALYQRVLQGRDTEAGLRSEIETLNDPDWDSFTEITRKWLEKYPSDIFTGESGDPGPLFVVAVREALEALDKARTAGES